MIGSVGSTAFVAVSCAMVLLSVNVFAYSDTTTSLGCIQSYIGDGDCDLMNDNDDCDYDGGDCCECTCVSTDDYVCGENGGYACLDPSASCLDDDDVTTLPDFEVFCIDDYISDGDCDDSNNYEQCDFDGGDCCECTCVSTEDFTCGNENNGGFACNDPRAPCFGDDDDDSGSYSYDGSAGFDFTPCLDEYIRDGDCDRVNNNEECGYDGGDCCECTCGSNLQYICGYHNPFQCVDPEAPCVDDPAVAGASDIVAGAGGDIFDCEEYEKGC